MAFIMFSFDIVHAQADGAAEVGVFANYEVLPDSRIEVPVEIRNVQDLYAIDIEIRFDPDVLSCEDADPGTDGIQPALGTFLDAGLALFNEVDNETGIVRLAMTQVNPSEPKSGDGVILVLYFRSRVEGDCELTVSKVELSDRGGQAIPAGGVSGRIVVTSGAEVAEATSIPVQDPTQMIPIPTLAPTATLTATPVPTKAPTKGSNQETISGESVELNREETAAVEEDESKEDAEVSQQNQRCFWIVDHWWVVLIVVVLVIGTALYLLKIKK